MSTATIPASSRAGRKSLTFSGVLRSEWIKFRSLRSTQMLLAFTFVAVVGVGAFAAWVRGTVIDAIMHSGPAGPGSGTGESQMTLQQAMDAASAQGFSIYGTPIAGLQLGVLVLGALAVLLISSEFGTGMIRSTLTAVPKRLPAFFAKAIVLVVVSYVLTLVAAFATFLVSIPILGSFGIDMSLSMDGVLYSILMGGVYVAGVSLIGLSLGTLIRSSAGGIIVLVGLLFLLEIGTSLLTLVPGDFWKYVGQYVPSVAGGRMLEIGDKAAFISPLAGGMIFLGWIVLVTVPALVSLKNRDV
ncbi:ABC transporter permease [Arthrobacter glacialis]|uniref:ABC transporter permease n=1 Tax=Arthrobacter glacialis TaxID=1664 RepID=A0A2S3ZX00_ARTGL|nr:ABC transporter permease [Arthrobacter glacialis]POH59428.1 ABC transporter permease [Arthrobacter glacialis]POH73805.1 ABC transporter permease [Arthrobacter glacialis]